MMFDGPGAPLQTAAASRALAEAASTTTSPPVREATIGFAGDVRIHSDAWNTAAVAGGFEFSPMLAAVTPRLANVDLAICHLDVTLARPSETVSGYPRFGAPRE